MCVCVCVCSKYSYHCGDISLVKCTKVGTHCECGDTHSVRSPPGKRVYEVKDLVLIRIRS